MDTDDRRAIEDLFAKLSAVERRSPPRDREAERFIQTAIGDAPAAPYYMAQTILVQEQALEEANRRIADLERNAEEGRDGRLFGGRAGGRDRYEPEQDERRRGGPWQAPAGGGFLAGAAQTAMGVAGGVIIGNLIGGALFGRDARADDREAADEADANGRDDAGDGDGYDSDAGGDFGGDF
jgi:hypothetical protein